MKTQIVILYPYENDTSIPALAGLSCTSASVIMKTPEIMDVTLL